MNSLISQWTWYAAAAASAALFASACEPLEHDSSNDPESVEEADAAPRAGRNDVESDRGAAGSGGSVSRAGRGGSDAGSERSTDDDADAAVIDDPSLSCKDRLPTGGDVTQVGGRASGELRWSGVIHVTESFTLRDDGTSLTIAPGTQIYVEPDAVIEIGWNSQMHEITAEGTERAPIRFCRADKAQGNWHGVDIGGSVLSSSALRYVVIEGAGQGADALVLQTGILIDHVWVRESASNGVSATNFRDDSAHLNVTSSARAPLVLNDPWGVQNLPAGGEFTGNGEDLARLTFFRVGIGVTFRAIGVPYQLDAGLSLRTGGKLVVEPGVEWRVGVDQGIELGWNSDQAELHLDGTADEPIVIRGADERIGSWQSLIVQASILTSSSMKHVHVLHGGAGDGTALILNAAIAASDLTLQDNAHRAFYIGENGLAPDSARFNVSGTKGAPGVVAPDALASLPAGGSYVGNEEDFIEVEGGNITRTGKIPEIDVPLRVLETVTVRNAAVVTIEPGVEFHMQSGVLWDVGWNSHMATLNAIGTAAKPIVFRGVLEQPGYWSGIVIGSNVTSSSRLEYVEIGHAGGDSAGNLRLNAPITVEQCKLYDSTGFGLVAPAEYSQDYEGLNDYENNAMGDVQRE